MRPAVTHTRKSNVTYSLPEAQHLVRALYRALLGRDADAAGLAHWAGALADGRLDLAALTTALTASDDYRVALARRLARQQARTGLHARVAAAAAAALAATPLRIVDVGAQILADEQHVYAALADHGLPCHIIGFEPIADKLSERRRADGATVHMYPDFIGDGRPHTFHLNAPDATSSLLPFNTALTRQLVHLSQLHTMHTEQVATRTLDEVLVDGVTVDFLKLDIQGFELPALRHAGAVLARTNVVHCEVSFAELYEGQDLFAEVEQLLRSHGFDFIDLASSCHYACHGPFEDSRDRLGWGDAIFFRRAAGLAPRDLLAQAAIALLVYDKPSLAAALAGPAHAALFAPEAA
jgi:FkbM family methyltransferase